MACTSKAERELSESIAAAIAEASASTAPLDTFDPTSVPSWPRYERALDAYIRQASARIERAGKPVSGWAAARTASGFASTQPSAVSQERFVGAAE